MYLASAWDVCGTWLAFALVNTMWGRICMLDEEVISNEEEKQRVILTFGVEISSTDLSQFPDIIPLTTFLKAPRILAMLPHDFLSAYTFLIESAVDSAGEMLLDPISVLTFWQTIVVALDMLSSQPWQKELGRLRCGGERSASGEAGGDGSVNQGDWEDKDPPPPDSRALPSPPDSTGRSDPSGNQQTALQTLSKASRSSSTIHSDDDILFSVNTKADTSLEMAMSLGSKEKAAPDPIS
ncbi:MAG: hypothetical protein TREMPRED_002348 [Tremellales sp. Tagirdzhanova-0007]|nr:MAG: hypothetical protein TREMPRED_002348 [Tremellales sp. Tagirdzhanova-0007]